MEVFMGMFSWLNEGSEGVNEDNGLFNAVGCLCLLAMYVDGKVTDDEKQTVIDIIKNDELFSNLSIENKMLMFGKMAQEVNDAVKSDYTDNLIAQKCNVIFDLGESEFAFEKINQVVNADGKVTDDEQSFLKSIGRTLRVPTEDSERDKGLLNSVMSLCLLVALLNKVDREDEFHMILGIIRNDNKFSQLSTKYKTKVLGESLKEVRGILQLGKSEDIDDFVMKKCEVIKNLKENSFAIEKIQQVIDADKRLSKMELKFIDSITKCLNTLTRQG